MGDRVDVEPGDRWGNLGKGLAAAVVVGLTAAALAGLVYFRFNGNPRAPGGSALGSVTVSSGVDFSCHLPVTAYGATAAMISFPDGAVTVDSTVATSGFGKPTGPSSYDVQLHRWVPVQQAWLSADGRQYAFATNTSGIPGQPPVSDVRVRDIVSGKDRTLWQGEGSANIVGWSGSTVVFMRQAYGSPQQPVYGPEVWGVAASGGGAHRIGPNPPPAPPTPGSPGGVSYGYGGPGMLAGGALWGLGSDQPLATGPPEPGKPLPFKGPNLLNRMDLRDGAQVTWYTAPAGFALSPIGSDGKGAPIVALSQPMAFTTPPPPNYVPPAPRVMMLSARDQAIELTPGGADGPRLSFASPDPHGVWFSAPGQLWLYRGGVLKKVADVSAALFPPPTPPPGATIGKPGAAAPPAELRGVVLQISGACA